MKIHLNKFLKTTHKKQSNVKWKWKQMSYLASICHASLWVSRYVKSLPLSQETTVREGTTTREADKRSSPGFPPTYSTVKLLLVKALDELYVWL